MRFVRYRVYIYNNNNNNKLNIIILCITPDCRSEYPDCRDGADADDFHRAPRDRSLVILCSTGVGNNDIPFIYRGKKYVCINIK